MGEAADQCRAVARLELVETGAVDHAGDHLSHIIGGLQVDGHQPRDLGGVIGRILRGLKFQRGRFHPVQSGHRLPGQSQRVGVVIRKIIRHPGEARVHVAAAQVFG